MGGREKAPAAICRKVQEAIESKSGTIDIWGDGTQTRSFMYIDDCVKGIDMITHCDALVATPINLGSSELIEINHLVTLAEEIGGVKLKRTYDPSAPKGVAGRNSDNTYIEQVLKWEPSTSFKVGLEKTYRWIETQRAARKAGRRVVD
jgi:nucleoside-diphosphate-sugar epimerase